MNHYKLSKIYKDGSSSSCWIVNGKYKIVHYDYRHSGGCTEKRSTFHAFYKPGWLSNWGNHINKSMPSYDSLDEALESVALFDKKHGHEATNGGVFS